MGEFDLIEKLTQDLSFMKGDLVVGVGDDCAVIKKNNDTYLLATVDAQVDNVHFLLDKISPVYIGQKAMAVNISDIAAMGGTPTYCLVSLFIPKKISTVCIEEVYAGLKESAKKYGITIVGGNITRAKQLAINISLLGEVSPKHLLLRSTAKVGDKVMVTGSLGNAAAGLYLLQHPDITIEKKVRDVLIKKQISPTPRMQESKVITSGKYATAMIDVSDGLIQDMFHITKQSNVGCILYEETLPLSNELLLLSKRTKQDPVSLALTGGEDYELLYTVHPKNVAKLKKIMTEKTNTLVYEIGEITTKEKGNILIKKNGDRIPIKPSGWDHLR